MATHFNTISSRATIPPLNTTKLKHHFPIFTKEPLLYRQISSTKLSRIIIKATNEGGDGSYLDMWKKAMDREKKSIEFQKIAENSVDEEIDHELEKKTAEFQKILEVPSEERDRVQKMQVIDRAAAAIAAANSLLKEDLLPQTEDDGELKAESGGVVKDRPKGILGSKIRPFSEVTPGPSFWTWTPPPSSDVTPVKSTGKALPSTAQNLPVMEKERSIDSLSIPFESTITHPLLPPIQPKPKVKESEVTSPILEVEPGPGLGVQFSTHAAKAVQALDETNESSPMEGVYPDGTIWWKETGIEKRPDGVICKWTLTRGVTVDKEWEEKYWEAADEFGYKELGSEKSGRNALGSVWREQWRESMCQIEGLVHFEKTADKWGKNLNGEEWEEKWWEHYDASGKAEKWADKWCSIDENTPLEDGHAHVWHEKWGEKYDGIGGSVKYTDKWAERFEKDGWSKWGDKWDERFDSDSKGVKQGETWWKGKHGEMWNRTWGEGHNGSGWVHKYGKSSSGEHWDTHEEQETWYEKFPHFGFFHCYDNSVQLREVKRPSEWS